VADTAISVVAPSSITYSRETMAVVGKYTYSSLLPYSNSSLPKGSGTSSRCSNRDFQVWARQGREQLVLLGAAVAHNRTGRQLDVFAGRRDLADRFLLCGNTELSVVHFSSSLSLTYITGAIAWMGFLIAMCVH
jgi:hypothetical protein